MNRLLQSCCQRLGIDRAGNDSGMEVRLFALGSDLAKVEQELEGVAERIGTLNHRVIEPLDDYRFNFDDPIAR
jgi:hypothetical protein